MTADDTGWEASAVCAQTDPRMFYPEIEHPFVVKAAKAICGTCPVTTQCLQQALDGLEEHGIWGGTTGKERLIMQRDIHGPQFRWPTPVEVTEPDIVAAVTDWDTATQCRRGHDLTQPGAISVTTKGDKRCLICKRESQRNSRKRNPRIRRREAG